MTMESPNLMAETRRRVLRIGAIASWLQLSVILIYILTTAIVGPRITSAEEFFIGLESHFLGTLLRVDLMMLILIGLYLGNFPALCIALWRFTPITTSFACLFTLIAVALSFAGESTFALLHLGKQYASAVSETERLQLLAAGEAILAGGWWHSTGSYMTGLLLQGGGIMISVAMLRSPQFNTFTGWAGIIGNTADLFQHLLSPFAPGISAYLSFAMILYLFWYPLMARDLFRLSKNPSLEN